MDKVAYRQAKSSRGGRPPDFSTERYRGRDVVERCFNRLTQFRVLVTRYAKRATYYRADVLIAETVLSLRT